MTNRQRAILYAVQKSIQAILEKEPDIQPGTDEDLSGESITFTLSPGTKVVRTKGDDGEGNVYKTATQNLYGYHVWAFLLQRLKTFKQANFVIDIIKEAWTQAVQDDEPVKLEQICPDLARFVAQLKKNAPKRKEASPRTFEKIALPQLQFQSVAQRKAA